MYGNLIQLSGDLTARTTWRRVPFGSVGGEGAIDEARLQKVLFRHADLLPLGEIDPAYDDPVPVCMELGTRAGSADALYLTPTGRIILAEFKLWRNPGARREVIGQILDYAGVLVSWSYDDLEREVRNRTKRSPFEIVSDAYDSVQEHIFVDRVYVGVKGSGWRDTGLWFDAYLDRRQRQILVALRRRTGVPKVERVFDEILRVLRADLQLQDDGQREIELPEWEEWSVGGKPRVGFRRSTEFLDGTEIRDFDEVVEWMRDHFNRLVTTLHPECRRRLRAQG